MIFSWRRINAIFIKDYKDFSRNMAVSTVLLLAPVLAAVYGRMGVTAIETHYLLIAMVFTMVASFVQSCLIAEEKEKNTLRGLMLSPASTLEILTGKSLLTFVLTSVTLVLSIFLAEYRPANIPVIAAAFLLSLLFYIGVGTLLGLFAKSVMEASVLVLPVMVLFTFGSFLKSLAEQYTALKPAMYLPNVQLLDIGIKVETGAGFADVLPEFAVIIGWVVLIFAVTVMIYRRRMMD